MQGSDSGSSRQQMHLFIFNEFVKLKLKHVYHLNLKTDQTPTIIFLRLQKFRKPRRAFDCHPQLPHTSQSIQVQYVHHLNNTKIGLNWKTCNVHGQTTTTQSHARITSYFSIPVKTQDPPPPLSLKQTTTATKKHTFRSK